MIYLTRTIVLLIQLFRQIFMEQTKVEPVIECFVSHGPINQLSFFYVLYEKK